MNANLSTTSNPTIKTSDSANVKYAIGIDIGGTKISAGLVRSDFTAGQSLVGVEKVSTPQNAGTFLSTIETLVYTIKEEHPDVADKISAIGISTAGVVNNRTGTVLGSTANLPFIMEVSNLKERLEARLNLPVTVENDANAAAYAEARVGAGRDYHTVMMVTLGTGVGGGMVVNNKIYSGQHFFAMEVGHICVKKGSRRMCTCGRSGCWEAFASGTGLLQTIHKHLKTAHNASKSSLTKLPKPIDSVSNHDLIAAWKEGDEIAAEIMEIWHQDIAIGIGSLMNVLDPAIIVIGGGLSQFVDYHKLATLTQKQAMLEHHLEIIKPACLGNDSGIVGAGFIALDAEQKHVAS